MQTAFKTTQIRACGLGLFLGLVLMCQAGTTDVHFDVLHYRTGVLTNVTVFTITKTDICVSHSRGLTSIKISDLDMETLQRLGLANSVKNPDGIIRAYAASDPAKAGQTKTTDSGKTTITVSNPNEMAARALNPLIGALKHEASSVPAALLAVTLGIMAVFYLFMCYCFKLIVQKTGTDPGFLIWVPVLQWLPLFQAAGMSGLWVLGFFVPILNLVTYVMWSIKIVQMREKSGLWTFLLIVPLTNFVALLYLAFSPGMDERRNDKRPITVVSPPSLSEAA